MKFFIYFILAFTCFTMVPASSGSAKLEMAEEGHTTLLYPPFWHTPFGIHRGTPDLLEMFIHDRTHLDHPQDLACGPLFSTLSQSAPGPEFQLTVLGANSGQANLIYNPALTRIDVLGDLQNAPGTFGYPAGIAVHPDGQVYVTDPERKQVLILTFDKDQLHPTGTLPDPPQGWKKPWGIAVDSQGTIYVTDALRHQILRYAPDHTFISAIGPNLTGKTQIHSPSAIAVTDPGEIWSFYRQGAIFIIDQDGRRIIRTDLVGNLHSTRLTGALDTPKQAASFAWLELDYYDNLWITDPKQNRIHKFDHQLNFLVSFGESGIGDNRFQAPTGIAIHRHFGQVFVADENSAHYFWIGTDILNARAEYRADRPTDLFVTFFLTEPSWVTLRSEKPFRADEIIVQKKWLCSGKHTHHWKTPTDDAEPPKIVLEAVATYSSSAFKGKRLVIRPQPISYSAPSP